jgi:crotonobetainyl-CoA:carnitine CoA-transferase CaiB-like acyl-CoA transferase
VISSYPGPAPTLGQHTGEVLEQELGLTAAELDDLSRAGIIDLVIEPSI